MFRVPSPIDPRLVRSASLCLCGALAIALAALIGQGMALAVALLVGAGLAVRVVILQHRLLAPAGIESALAATTPEQATALQHRLAPAHPVTGLPLREALLARMKADRGGMLGILAFADFNRLTAFDPALGDRVFATLTARLQQMLSGRRFAAQVDRGHVALWFAGAGNAAARAELDAIAYALGEAIEDGGDRIVPQIRLRLARFDAAGELDANTFLARALASFTLPAGAVDDAADHAVVDRVTLARDDYALEQDLRQAIARREFALAFQPLIDAGTGRVSGAEALLRWTHPTHGAVPPSRFIPIVEAMGLSSEIGMWALNAAARAAHGWVMQGLGNLRVAVNVSGLQLERDDLPLLIQRTLQHHELAANTLEIELTESVATSDTAHCRHVFTALRAMGVKLAVDDFGTGYSGFGSLRTLAFDKIKIDRAFVSDVDTRRDSQAICQSIIALGRGLGIRVLAEGVERREEYLWMRRHGCQHFQGYYFGRPMDSTAFVAFVRNTAGLQALLRPGIDPPGIKERMSA